MATLRLNADPSGIIKGSKQAKEALKTVGTQAKQTEKQVVTSVTNQGNALTRLGTNMTGRTRFVFNNTANQLGDMAVQASMGTDMFRVMGMQLPQLAGGFALLGGSMGVVMPLLGVLAAIGFPIIAAMRMASGGADDFGEAVEKLSDKLSGLNTAIKSQNRPLSNWIARYGLLGQRFKDTEASFVKMEQRILQGQFDETIRRIGYQFLELKDITLAIDEMAALGTQRQGGATSPYLRARQDELSSNASALLDMTEQFDISLMQAQMLAEVYQKFNEATNFKDQATAIQDVVDVFSSLESQTDEGAKALLDYQKEFRSAFDLSAKMVANNKLFIDSQKGALQISITAQRQIGRGSVMPSSSDLFFMRTGGEIIQTKEKIKVIDKELNKLKQYAAQVKPIITLTQEYELATSTLLRAKEKGAITEQEYADKLGIVTSKYQIATGAALDFAKIATSSAKSLENSLMSLAEGTLTVQDAFKSMAVSVIKELYRVLVVQQIVNGAMGMFGYQRMAGGGFGKASTVAPTVGFAGGGYTGSGSRSGGVDGRGGFHAILHPQETVVDHTKGQNLGTTINQTINVSTGVQQTVRTEIIQLMPKIAETTKLAVLDAKRRGGSFSAAFN